MKKLLMLAFLLSSAVCHAQFHSQAQWICPSDLSHEQNQWFIFRKKYSVSEPLKEKLLARIAVDSKYWLWINGKMVVFEGQLKRGPTPADTYFDEVDITPYIKKGDNTIAVLVWFWGREDFCHKNSGTTGLLFEAINSQVTWFTDKSWKYFHHDSFGTTGEPVPNYRLPEFNIRYLVNPKFDNWMMPGYDDSFFLGVTEQGPAGCAPWNNLWIRPFPQWKNSGLVQYANSLKMPFVTDGNPIIMKLPLNYSITPYFKIDASKELSIDIRTDNYKGGSEYNVRTEYITGEGVQEFETYGYMNGHEVIYSFPAGIKVLDLRYRRTSFPSEHTGSFSCDDTSLNVLWQKALNTMDLNMRDAIQDADRERSQWWGDAVIVSGEILYTCDTNGICAIRKAISNLVEWQRSDSSLYSPVPSGKYFSELPQQMLASIGKYGFWNYFRYTGDTAMIRYVYPHVRKYLALWHLGTDGLVKHRPENINPENKKLFWSWTDWGENIDMPLCENAWYYMAIGSAAKMAALLGFPVDENRYKKQMLKLKYAYNGAYWTGKGYRSPGFTGETDDRGNGLAIVSGLADSSKWPYIRELFEKTFHAGPYLEKYILESYFIMNDPQGGIERMKNRYGRMIASSLTTLWEGWDIGLAKFGGGSYNHGWAGGPLILMSQYIAGVSPGDDGFTSVLIRPQLADLKHVECTVPNKRGLIKVELKQAKDGKLTAGITLPAGLPGVLEWKGKRQQLREGYQKVKL
jgi:alpha-L-rhamnosidase